MSAQNNDFPRGMGSPDRPLTCDQWAQDSKADSPIITTKPDHDPNYRQVDYKRYYDPAYAQQEVEQIWTKQWMYAAREEDLPTIGDRLPFNIGSLSFIIVHHADNEFKAFYNSCLHRGAALCSKSENKESLKCPYHGWEWNNDGSLKRIPGHWDFTDVTRQNASLREVKLERWGGFIFINADPDCAPLAETLGFIPEHFTCFDYENRYTAVHFRKLITTNWKSNQEAFQESYHLSTTHPEAVPFNADSQVQYDVWKTPNGAIGRTVTPGCTPSMVAEKDATIASATVAYTYVMKDWHYPNGELPELDFSGDMRKQAADWHRQMFRETYGKETTAPDTVLLDSLLYFVFPNICFWLTEAVPMMYRFLPHETDPEKSYFEVRVLKPIPAGQERPAPFPCVEIAPHESILEKVPEMNFLGLVFDQDNSNLPLVQKGMRAADPTRSFATLGRYQESVIQHWHELFDRFIPPRNN